MTDWKKNTNYKGGYGPTHQVGLIQTMNFLTLFQPGHSLVLAGSGVNVARVPCSPPPVRHRHQSCSNERLCRVVGLERSPALYNRALGRTGEAAASAYMVSDGDYVCIKLTPQVSIDSTCLHTSVLRIYATKCTWQLNHVTVSRGLTKTS